MATATRASPGSELTIDSKVTPMQELVFEVTQEADGGFIAESLGEGVITQAVEAYFFDSTPPKHIRLHLVRDEVLATG
jgi:hypothetical protein